MKKYLIKYIKNKWLILLILPILLLLLLFLSTIFTSYQPPLVVLSGQTMGTQYQVRYISKHSKANITRLIEVKLMQINMIFSSWLPSSEISKLNQAPINQWLDISQQLWLLLQKSMLIYQQSSGYFDISLGRLLSIWGFYQTQPKNKPTKTQIKFASQNSGMDKIILNNNKFKKTAKILLDMSAIAKGYGVDELAKLLSNKGIKDFMIDIGGEIFAQGLNQHKKPWRIGINNPNGLTKIVELSNQGIATSGNYHNFVTNNNKQYGHIFNAKTKQPNHSDFTSVSVIHNNTAMADAYATTIMAMDKTSAATFIKQYNINVILMP